MIKFIALASLLGVGLFEYLLDYQALNELAPTFRDSWDLKSSLLYSSFTIIFSILSLISFSGLGLILWPVTEPSEESLEESLEESSTFEDWTLRALLGSALVSLSYFLLGISAGYSVTTCKGLFLLLSCVGLVLFLSKGPELRLSKLSAGSLLRVEWLAAAAVGLYLLAQYVFALTPTTDWDDQSHQLNLAVSLLNIGGLAPQTLSPPLNYPASEKLLFLPGVSFGLEAVPRFISLSLALSTLILTYCAGRRLAGNWVGLIAALLFFSSSCIWEVSSSSRSDSSTMAYCFATVFFYIFRCPTLSRRNLLSLGLLAGMATGSKVTGVAFLVICFLILLAPKILRTRPLPSLKPNLSLILVLLIGLIPSFFWYGRNQITFGSALYPAKITASGLKRSEPLFLESDSIIPDKSFFKEADAILVRTSDPSKTRSLNKPLLRSAAKATVKAQFIERDIGIKGGALDIILEPESFFRKDFIRYSPLLLIAPLFLVFHGPSSWLCKMILASVVFALIFLKSAPLVRYVLPIFPFFSLATAYLLVRPFEKLSSMPWIWLRRLTKLVLASQVLVFVSYPWSDLIDKYEFWKPQRFLLGELNHLTYINRETGENAFSPLQNMTSWLNSKESQTEKVLLIGDSRNMRIFRPTLNDHEQLGRYAVPWLQVLVKAKGSYEETHDYLLSDGFKYIAVDISYYMWAISRAKIPNIDRTKLSLLNLYGFLDRFCEIEYSDGGRIMFRINEKA